jgi:hypothetical protein
VSVYFDTGHINTLYAASAEEFFTEWLRAIIGAWCCWRVPELVV